MISNAIVSYTSIITIPLLVNGIRKSDTQGPCEGLNPTFNFKTGFTQGKTDDARTRD